MLRRFQDAEDEPAIAPRRFDTRVVRTIRPIPILGWAAVLALADLAGVLALTGLYVSIYSPETNADWIFVCGSVPVWLLSSHSLQLYDKSTLLGALRSQLLKSSVSIGLIALLALALAPTALPSGTEQARSFILAFLGALIWVWVLRIGWQRYARAQLLKGHCLDRALLLTGSAEDGSALQDQLELHTMGEVRVAAVANIPSKRNDPSCDWIEGLIRNGVVDRVFIANFHDLIADTNILLRRLSHLSVDVTLVPDFAGVEAPALHVDRIGPRPIVDVNRAPLSPIDAALKRLEDLLILLVALPLFSVLCPLIAVAIKLDSPGPVFFRQWRAGFHGQRFRIWKFRTMRDDMRDERAERQTGRGDARVTRVGRILRSTSLDELPQLLNVLIGDMSVVGPRPHALGMTTTGQPMHEVAVDYPSRHRVKPGITGWAQVSGCRGEVDTAEKLYQRVMLDCYYIEHWSIGFDLWIILRTVGCLFLTRDAY